MTTITTRRTRHQGKYRAQVQGYAGVRYETPAYLTEQMALADAKCWAAFHTDENPQEAHFRMAQDANLVHDEVPIETISVGDYIWRVSQMSGYTDRRGEVYPSHTIQGWFRVTAAWKSINATANRPAQYRLRLAGVTHSEAGSEGQTMKVLTYPDMLEAAEDAADKYVRSNWYVR
ncbi:hypothetical protein ACH4M0_11355 [Streptomyces albidoflavus]|jgi:hypothetical protein